MLVLYLVPSIYFGFGHLVLESHFETPQTRDFKELTNLVPPRYSWCVMGGGVGGGGVIEMQTTYL